MASVCPSVRPSQVGSSFEIAEGIVTLVPWTPDLGKTRHGMSTVASDVSLVRSATVVASLPYRASSFCYAGRGRSAKHRSDVRPFTRLCLSVWPSDMQGSQRTYRPYLPATTLTLGGGIPFPSLSAPTLPHFLPSVPIRSRPPLQLGGLGERIIFTDRMLFLTPSQQRQRIEGTYLWPVAPTTLKFKW